MKRYQIWLGEININQIKFKINYYDPEVLICLTLCVPSYFFPTTKDVYMRPWCAVDACTVVAHKIQGGCI